MALRLIYIARVILWLAAFGLLSWIFYQNLVPSGVLILRNQKGNPGSPISDLHPEARLIDLQVFFVDPVYFEVKVPRAFETVTVDIAWQNKSQPILELGARRIRGEFGFVFKALQNKLIDNILSPLPPPLTPPRAGGDIRWTCQRYGETVFCQRQKRYESLSAFLAKPGGRVLSYRYPIPKNIKHDVMNVETKIEDYDYLIADYTPPESLSNDWFRRTVIFDWSDFALWRNELSFILSAPQLHQGHGQITVGDTTVTLRREALDWEGFKEYVMNQFRRFKK